MREIEKGHTFDEVIDKIASEGMKSLKTKKIKKSKKVKK